MKSILLFGCLFVALLGPTRAASADELAQNFAQPPDSARPWVYYWWGNGSVTKEGITADLEAMKRVGIGGVLLMHVGTTYGSRDSVQLMTPEGPVTYGSPLWYEMMQHLIHECARLGLQLDLTNAPGWAGTGGPWNTPEHSQQKLVWTQMQVKGPAHLDQVLAQPQMLENYYQDISVVAFPTPDADLVRLADFSPKLTASTGSAAPFTLPKPVPRGAQPYVQVELDKPFTARELTLALKGSPDRSFVADLQTSDDGVTFTTAHHFFGQLRGVDTSFPEVTARFFRIVFLSGDKWFPDTFGVDSLDLSPRARIDNLAHETLVSRGDVTPLASYPTLPPGLAVDSHRQVDLRTKMDAGGHLAWDVPEGNWTILRLGHTSDGVHNHPAGKGGYGLEVDKLSRQAMDAFFAGPLSQVIDQAGPLAGKTMTTAHIDSWESGSQNWSPQFAEEFLKRRGYDLHPYLPALTGMIVDSPETTERFLWDFRQTAADMMADNYSGRMQELLHRHGMQLSIECYGGSDADNGTYGEHADLPMCEFWREDTGPNGLTYDIQPISIAHVWGRPVVASEAFTSDGDEHWLGWPGGMKAEGDWAFAAGVNHFVFHRGASQPFENIKPGLSIGPFGIHYDRNETWWEQSKPWHDYVARCQYLLRQGVPVADICRLVPERAPVDLPIPLGPGPHGERPGYNFDTTSAEAVIQRFSVRDGKIVLPEGTSYRVLVLPQVQTMTPRLLDKVKSLVSAGATVIGPKPLKSPSLSNYPACDDAIKSLADEIWGDCDGAKVKEHAYGQGRVIWGRTPEEVLQGDHVPKDFVYEDSQGGPPLYYTHRIVGGTDIYFIANRPKQGAVEGMAHFRVAGRAPQFWHADNGTTEPVAAYTQKDGVTSIPVRLEANESVFVVFPPAAGDSVAAVTLDGAAILPAAKGAGVPNRTARLSADAQGHLRLQAWKSGAYGIETVSGATHQVTIPAIPAPSEITGPWQVTFPFANGDVSFDRLASWSESPRDEVKYFSGTAIYHKIFQVPAAWIGNNQRLELDLGDVEVIADVTLNGKPLGILWTSPYRVDVTDAVKAGDNSLEIKLTDLWPNRMIGDARIPGVDGDRLPDGQLKSWPQWVLDGKPNPTGRVSFTTVPLWKKTDALIPSGLIGPVTLIPSVDVAVP